MGNKQESVSQGESKHSLPARGLVQLCVQENPVCLALFNSQTRAPGDSVLLREPRTGSGEQVSP